MPKPVFDFVLIFGDTTNAKVDWMRIDGMSTRHDSGHSDRGRLYMRVEGATEAGKVKVTFYSDPQMATVVATGDNLTIGATASIVSVADEDYIIWVRPAAFSAAADFVVVPTFAVDEDINPDEDDLAAMPGYDPKYGLAHFQADAHRYVMTGALPAVIPHIFGGFGMAAFIPSNFGVAPTIPDFTKLANVDALREAQAALAKAQSATTREHLAEFKEMAADARLRFTQIMESIGLANSKDEEAEVTASVAAGPQFGYWIRG